VLGKQSNEIIMDYVGKRECNDCCCCCNCDIDGSNLLIEYKGNTFVDKGCYSTCPSSKGSDKSIKSVEMGRNNNVHKENKDNDDDNNCISDKKYFNDSSDSNEHLDDVITNNNNRKKKETEYDNFAMKAKKKCKLLYMYIYIYMYVYIDKQMSTVGEMNLIKDTSTLINDQTLPLSHIDSAFVF
jgi:hypothetical protein